MDRDHLKPLKHNALALDKQSPIHQNALSLLSVNHATIRERYFTTVHQWFPFISQKRLANTMESPDSDGCEFLLVLCMQLNVVDLEEPAKDTLLYAAARSLCALTETTGIVSLRLLQSLVLLAVFEMCQAIHPAAYLSIGRAARLGLLMGLHGPQGKDKLFKPAETWTLDEELRRTWWAVFVLDRYVVAFVF